MGARSDGQKRRSKEEPTGSQQTLASNGDQKRRSKGKPGVARDGGLKGRAKEEPKNHKKAIRAEFLRGLAGELKTDLRPGFPKARFCFYLLHLN